jgi:SAM-dependent methyltransferase
VADDAYGRDFYQAYGGLLNQYWWARRFYASIIRRYASGGKLLEIGCGLGHVLARLEDSFDTYGIDVSDYAIDQARENTPKSRLEVAPAEAVASLDGPFDAIAAFHVVEHLSEPGHVLQECARSTRLGGTLIFATPNPDAPFAERKGDRWYGRRDPTHISLKPPEEWRRITEDAGYSIRRTFGDGLWDVPYVPVVPSIVQLGVFGAPMALQTLAGVPFIPVRFGEALIVIAEKDR